MQENIYLELDRPGSISFAGSSIAENFTKEISQSLDGVLAQNYYYDAANIGFISASIGGRPWDGTMWSRDAGVFLRELVHWGYTGRACLIVQQLVKLCAPNPEGFYTFPERFDPGIPAYGEEIDGTASILVGLSMLVRRLKLMDEDLASNAMEEVMAFVCQPKSPLLFLLEEIDKKPLLSGTGEFGGGMFVDGEYCNVVQNMLVVNALSSWHKAFEELQDDKMAGRCLDASHRLEDNIRTYLVKDGRFIWCVEPEHLSLPTDVMKASANVGFSGINGAGAMICDVLNEKELSEWWGRGTAVSTFRQLLQSPQRKTQYEKYGMYLQFESFCEGMLTSPSYGQGYAIQLALSMGMKEEAGRMFRYLVEHTMHPHSSYQLQRDSKYWFYERMLSPDYFTLPKERQTVTEGCGALNLINVSEPLKIARMIAGVNDLMGETPSPVFIEGIERIQIRNWAMLVQGKLTYQDFDITRS